MACFDQLPNEILARIIFFLFEAHGCIASIPFGPEAISTPLLVLRVVCSASCFCIPRVFQSDKGLTDRDVLARFDSNIVHRLASRLHAIDPIPRSFHWHAKQCPSLLVRLTFEAVKFSPDVYGRTLSLLPLKKQAGCFSPTSHTAVIRWEATWHFGCMPRVVLRDI